MFVGGFSLDLYPFLWTAQSSSAALGYKRSLEKISERLKDFLIPSQPMLGHRQGALQAFIQFFHVNIFLNQTLQQRSEVSTK